MQNSWNVLSVVLCYVSHDCSSDVNHSEYVVKPVMTTHTTKTDVLDITET